MKLNNKVAKPPLYTHEGARAVHITKLQELRRSVAACMLWEGEFYENGDDIATRIRTLAAEIDPVAVAGLAFEARHVFKLRHVPLLLLEVLTRTAAGRNDGLVRKTIANVISRADELAEFLAIYRKFGGKSLSGQVKKGLAEAATKFDAYQFAKYNRDAEWKLRDVVFLSHAKPKDREQALLMARLVNKEKFPEKTKGGFAVAEALAPDTFEKLKPADTWEVALSGGQDKKAYWTGALEKTAADGFVEGSLGYMALLRNLRNMQQAGVDDALIRKALLKRQGIAKVLPFRFITAAKHAPKFEAELDQALLAMLAAQKKLPGKTIVVVDVSGSMGGGMMSSKSEMDRMHVAASLAAIAREICEHAVIYATAGSDMARQHKTKLVPARHGMALVDAICGETYRELGGGGIFLTPVMRYIAEQEKDADRIIVITDEQDCAVADKDKPSMAAPFGTKGNYLINVGSYKNGIGYGKWTHIDGFSENVIRYIREVEGLGGDESSEESEEQSASS
jgi:60 kDa SS-A/Ro ribonucleoprotein